MVEVETLVAEVELDGYSLKCEGVLDSDKWEVTMSFPNNILPSKSWFVSELCFDQDDVEQLVWSEVMRLTKKYSVVSFYEGLIEQEEEE